MGIITSIQESAQGWQMFFGNIFGGGIQNSAQFGGDISKTEIGGALIGTGFSEAQQRYAGIKAGGVSEISAQEAAPVGVRYMTSTRTPYPPPKGVRYATASRIQTAPPLGEGARIGVRNIEKDTPATLIEKMQKSIGESAEGWRMGFAHVAGKAKTGIEKSVAGWQWGISEAGSKVSESFGNVGDWFKSVKWQLLLPVIILAFIAVMVAIGYSGLGAPAARVAEREYVKRR